MRLFKLLLPPLPPLLALAVGASPLIATAASNPFDRAAAAKAVDRDYDACLLDDKPLSMVVTFRSSGDILIARPPNVTSNAVEACIAGKLRGVRIPAFSGPDVSMRKTVQRGLLPAAQGAPAPHALLTLTSANVKGLGRGHVQLVVQNQATDEHDYVIAGVLGAGHGKTFAGGIAPGSGLSTAPISMPWPAACATDSTTEMRIQLRGRDADPTPKLLRLTASACTARFSAIDDPVQKDKLSAADLANRNAGRLYYQRPEIVSRPTACGDKIIVRAELVNATADVIHHAALRLLQAGVVPEAGITLNPGHTRVVERAAVYQGVSVPIGVEGAHDDATASPLTASEQMRDYTAGVSLLADCAMSAALLPLP